MKSAILISGHIRTWNITKKSFMENLYLPIIKYTNITPDIYIYTYNKLDSTIPKEIKKYSEKECADRIESVLEDDEIKGMFKDLNVVKIGIDKTKDFKCSFDNSQDYAIYNQFRMLYFCNQLKSQSNTTLPNGENKHYDFVIRTRFDLFYNFSPDTISNFINSDFKNDVLYISQDLAPGVTNDMFAISDEKTMDIYCSKFLMFEELKNISLENSQQIDSAHSLFDKNVKGLKLEKIFKTELCRPLLHTENKRKNLLIIFGKIPDTNWDKCSALDIPCKDVVLFLYDSYENSKKYIDKLIEKGKNVKFIKFLDNKHCVCYTEWFNIINLDLNLDLTEYDRIIKIIPNLKFKETVNYDENSTLVYESEGKEIITSIFYSLKSEDFKRMINEAKIRIDKSKYLNLDEFYEEICGELRFSVNKKKFSLIDVVYDVWTDF